MTCPSCGSTGPHYCDAWARWVGRVPLRILVGGDPRKIAGYFGSAEPRPVVMRVAAPPRDLSGCVHLGDWLREESGVAKTTNCTGCARPTPTRLKIYQCGVHGEITLSKCKGCSDYDAS